MSATENFHPHLLHFPPRNADFSLEIWLKKKNISASARRSAFGLTTTPKVTAIISWNGIDNSSSSPACANAFCILHNAPWSDFISNIKKKNWHPAVKDSYDDMGKNNKWEWENRKKKWYFDRLSIVSERSYSIAKRNSNQLSDILQHPQDKYSPVPHRHLWLPRDFFYSKHRALNNRNVLYTYEYYLDEIFSFYEKVHNEPH